MTVSWPPMQRTTQRLSLTDEVQAFYARSKELLAGGDEAEAETTSHSGVGQVTPLTNPLYAMFLIAACTRPIWVAAIFYHFFGYFKPLAGASTTFWPDAATPIPPAPRISKSATPGAG
jgi:hypothetical protein